MNCEQLEFTIPADEVETFAKLADNLAQRKRLSRSEARKVRRALIEECGGVCPICHEHHALILQVHHVDPVQELGMHDQLIPLCPNCHAYVHLLRGARKDEAKFQQIKDSLIRVYQGDAKALEFLVAMANAVSTMETIQLIVQERTQGESA